MGWTACWRSYRDVLSSLIVGQAIAANGGSRLQEEQGTDHRGSRLIRHGLVLLFFYFFYSFIFHLRPVGAITPWCPWCPVGAILIAFLGGIGTVLAPVQFVCAAIRPFSVGGHGRSWCLPGLQGSYGVCGLLAFLFREGEA